MPGIIQAVFYKAELEFETERANFGLCVKSEFGVKTELGVKSVFCVKGVFCAKTALY